ncbi:MAG TPA: hypothetical protein VIE47_08525 [Methylocystis sp.]|jgi:hypothetical protein
MKTTSFVSAVTLAITHGVTASALIISSSNFERTRASLERLNVAGNNTADSADQNRSKEKHTPSTENESDKGKGAIKPEQNIDPGIVRPAPVPDPNSTPVIKPPGTPGGAPGPEPK